MKTENTGFRAQASALLQKLKGTFKGSKKSSSLRSVKKATSPVKAAKKLYQKLSRKLGERKVEQKSPEQKRHEAQLQKAGYVEKAYPQGPLNRTPETKAVFDIAEALALGKPSVAFKKNASGEVEVTFSSKTETTQQDGKVAVMWEEPQTKKLKDLMKGANFSHINLSEETLQKLNENISSQQRSDYSKKQEEKESIKNHDQTWLKDVSIAEYMALKEYIGPEYPNMNSMLRADGLYTPANAKEAQKTFLDCVLASNALNKAPDIPTSQDTYVFRKEGLAMRDVYKEYVKEQKIEHIGGFMSTAQEGGTFSPENYAIKILIRNVAGKDLSIIPGFDKEKELLLPPGTQLRWTTHEEAVTDTDSYGHPIKVHVFTAEGANTPHDASA